MADREIRGGIPAEIRADDSGGLKVVGYAAVFNEEADIGGEFREVIAPGAFKNALKRGDDVVFLVNHEGLPLARTRSGTLKLKEDEHGLYIETELDPTDPDVMRIKPKMERGDMDKMSFAFRIAPGGQIWDDDGDLPLRTIHDVELGDVSIVNTPAYGGTEIALRSLQAHRKSENKGNALRRLRIKKHLNRHVLTERG